MIQVSILGLIGVILGSAKSVFAKMAYETHADAVSILFLRMLISLPFLMLIGFLYEKKQHSYGPLSWRDIILIAGWSFIGYYLSALFDFIGLLYVDAALERLIVFTYPTMIIIISAIFLRREIKPRQVSAIVISYIGILISFGNKLSMEPSAQFWIGVIFIFLSALTYAVFLIASEGIISRLGSMRFTTIATLSMTVCVLVHAVFAGKTNVALMDSKAVWACVLMAILSTIAPIYMFNIAVGKLGVTNMSVIACLGPACTLILASVLIKEKITMWEISGTFVVMLGVLIISFEKLRKESLSGYLRKSLSYISIWERPKKY